MGGSPLSLYLTSENVDKLVAKAVKLGATQQGPVMDMFWGDRSGTIVDPEGVTWMIGTHIAEPTAKEMQKAMKQMQAQAASGTGS
jgi:PhnB protein